jgi:hypothetical protein
VPSIKSTQAAYGQSLGQSLINCDHHFAFPFITHHSLPPLEHELEPEHEPFRFRPSIEPRKLESVQFGPNQTQSNPIKPNQTQSNPIKPNQTQSNPIKPNQTQSN